MARNTLIRNKELDLTLPVLIAGATASGKSALALEIAAAQGRSILNADALQVYGCWRVLTARPTAEDETVAPHLLYGHVAPDAPYSVGDWLREVAPLLSERPAPIIVGGTGLYFRALTEGLADIPPTPAEIRATADARLAEHGLGALLAELDAATAQTIDAQNPARVQRAWEVLRATGRGLVDWQRDTPPPLVAPGRAHLLHLDAPRDWLEHRITARFDQMIASGALEEARAMLAHWEPRLPAAKAIGAPELIAHLRGEITLPEAREDAIIATRRYAKRQRTWFRARMGTWRKISPAR
ncbi:MAG: tRNA (adenosine(37)-N6)-dimethylallyltransferase MiaA [Pseudomonadota bacterium]